MDDSESSNVDGTRSVPKEQLLPMGAVTRRTGIGEHTLRVWERRFGFPQPLRLPSGHRRYPMDQVHQLTMIHEALRCGYRAGDVVRLPREKLAALLEECGQDSESEESSRGWLHEIFEAAEKFDRTVVKKALYQAAGNLGLPRFLRERVTPLLSVIGEACARGDIEIRHEHFISEVHDEVLRDLRRPLEETANGRPVVLAGLEYEHHVLGQHVAALAVATAGRDCLVLGAETPAEEIARALDRALRRLVD
ncbi:MAG: MerR family transcriptional regulator [Acidobacteriota bacterium]